ncbi:upstream activation factor subunit spp27-like isoform X2 [Zingiber officinale]|uniref:upstream activation factor subunit spp27-like isoform X2 n=1 Tax=Zingiber officinale TaxID=94328 RepID=UPI001C4C54E4|nr:upstream activation factor subunit spp27-like isoform X2 [Zingiber officinale]
MAAATGFLTAFSVGDLASPITLPRRAALIPGRWAAAGALRVAAEAGTDEAEKKKKKQWGITKPRPVSPQLQAVVGEVEIPRTQALKKIWAYIKENNLQDPDDKRIILCDEKLQNIFGKDRVGFLEISGLLNPHFTK